MDPTEASDGRVGWLDTLKGLGIALVVLGHLANGSLIQHVIYVFHMPLFFFISGFLHKPAPDLRRYLNKKTLHLLVPYGSFSILASIPYAIHAVRHGTTALRTEHGLFVLLWGGAEMKGIYGVLWFLTCLFLTQQLANWILVRFDRSTLMVVSAVALGLSYAYSIWLPRMNLPWDANVVLAALPFFAAGYALRGFDFGQASLVGIGGASVAAATALLWRGVPIGYDLRSDVLGIPLITPMLAAGCILFCIVGCRMLTPLPVIGPVLKKLGIQSLGIMLIHKFLQAVPTFSRIERYGPLISFAVVMAGSYVLANGMNLSRATRALLLGSEKDFNALVHTFGRRCAEQDEKINVQGTKSSRSSIAALR